MVSNRADIRRTHLWYKLDFATFKRNGWVEGKHMVAMTMILSKLYRYMPQYWEEFLGIKGVT